MKTQATRASNRRRARTLAGALSVLVAAMALYAQQVRAQDLSGAQRPGDSLGTTTLAAAGAGAGTTIAWTRL
jgi:hypothetical protein